MSDSPERPERPNPYSLLNFTDEGEMPKLLARHGYRSAKAKQEFFSVNVKLVAPLMESLIDQCGVSPLNHELYVFSVREGTTRTERTLSVRVSDGWASFGSAELNVDSW